MNGRDTSCTSPLWSPVWSQLVKVKKWAVKSWPVSWLQGMSGEEKKNKTIPGTVPHSNTTWHRTSWGGGRRQVPFIIVALYKIKDQCPALDIMCPELLGWQMRFKGLSIFNMEQMWAFDLVSSSVFPAATPPPRAGQHVCTERPEQGLRQKLKQLLNSHFIGFHNMRGLWNRGVRVSRLHSWAGMSSSLPSILMASFWRLNKWCDGGVLLTGMCQCLLSPCYSLMII